MADVGSPESRPSSHRGMAGWGGVVVLVLGGIIRACVGGAASKPPVTATQLPPAATARSAFAAPLSAPPAIRPAVIAHLHVRGQDGTAELQQLVASLTDAEVLALGIGVLLTGTDTYAARVQITNTGTIPVRVFPENLRVHFGGEVASVTTVRHPQFLQRGVLTPGGQVAGLTMYRARLDIGAAIRLGGGGLSYADNTISVTYDP